MFKPRLSLLIGVGCFGVLLAACTPAAPPTEAPAAAAAPAAASFVCADKIGCVDIAPGKPVHIAYAMVVVGPDATLGIDSMRGVEIAIDDKNKMLLGHPIELTGEDTGCNPEGGQAASCSCRQWQFRHRASNQFPVWHRARQPPLRRQYAQACPVQCPRSRSCRCTQRRRLQALLPPLELRSVEPQGCKLPAVPQNNPPQSVTVIVA